VASGAPPTMPWASSVAATSAATAVPWEPDGVVPPLARQESPLQSPPSTTLPLPERSELPGSTPSSITATSTPAPRMRGSVAQAAGTDSSVWAALAAWAR
jgi:hypothetical protein